MRQEEHWKAGGRGRGMFPPVSFLFLPASTQPLFFTSAEASISSFFQYHPRSNFILLLRDTTNSWVASFLRVLSPRSLGHCILDWWQRICLQIRHWMTLTYGTHEHIWLHQHLFLALRQQRQNILLLPLFFSSGLCILSSCAHSHKTSEVTSL